MATSEPHLTATASKQKRRPVLLGSDELAEISGLPEPRIPNQARAQNASPGAGINAGSVPIPEGNALQTSALLPDEASTMQLRAFFELLDQWDREAHATKAV